MLIMLLFLLLRLLLYSLLQPLSSFFATQFRQSVVLCSLQRISKTITSTHENNNNVCVYVHICMYVLKFIYLHTHLFILKTLPNFEMGTPAELQRWLVFVLGVLAEEAQQVRNGGKNNNAVRQ